MLPATPLVAAYSRGSQVRTGSRHSSPSVSSPALARKRNTLSPGFCAAQAQVSSSAFPLSTVTRLRVSPVTATASPETSISMSAAAAACV